MAIVKPVKTAPGARRRLAVFNPATLEPIGEIEVQTADDVRAAIKKAREIQPAWAALSFEQRGAYMLKALKILLDRQNDFVKVILSETPRPLVEAMEIEIYAICDALDYYAKETGKFLSTQKVEIHGSLGMMKDLYVLYKPLGVVGIISPWNGPFVLSMMPTIEALMAGNAVILKPSSITPFTGKLIGDLFEEAGLPAGAMTVITGDSTTGRALLEGGVNKISFTGSVAVGREVAVACAERLIPCTLELGGADAMIVCADANLDNAAAGAMAGSFVNAGQYCCGTERVYVVEAVADEFIRKVVERTSKLRQAAEGDFDVGALYSENLMEIVENSVKDAAAKGAKVLVGGRRNPNLKGLFYEPTVIVNVNHSMLIMSDEVMGPVLAIMRVKDDEEAIRMANDSNYGLSGSVYTNDLDKGLKIAERITTGSVNVNDMAVTFGVPEAPFGGVKNSGIGRVNGETGLKSYCHVQPVLIDKFVGQVTADKYPCTVAKGQGMQEVCKALWGTQFA